MFKSDILQIVKNYLDEFFIFEADDRSYILIFFSGFKPYADFKRTSCAVSSYYVKSNEIYFLCRAICGKLNEEGVKAEVYKEHNLKKIAFENCGLVKGRNTLLYHEKYGSYFAIGAVKIFESQDSQIENAESLAFEGNFADTKGGAATLRPHSDNLITNEKKHGTNCNNCGRCINACPVSALKDGELIRERCLRQKMNGVINDDLSAKLLENNILGCEICQSVCPLNEKIEKVAPIKDLEDILNISNIISNAEKGNKHLESLGKYIGKNYAKCTRILSLAINSAGNSKEKNYLKKVEKFTESKEEAVRINAMRAVRLLKD